MRREIWLGWGLLWLIACHPERIQDIPQHVLVIVSDDHSIKTLGAYGATTIRTPNLDRLASGGVRFERAYAAAPICSASRQSLLTGKYPHATGVNLLFTPFPDAGNVTIAEQAQAAGIRTALIGKDHWNHWMWEPLYTERMPTHGFDKLIGRSAYRYAGRDNFRWVPPDVPTRENQKGAGIAWQKNADMLPVGTYK
ncbi:MAG: sulfatase-like hydrolase/transferase, partial [Bacteroidota bacterium]